MEIKNTIYQLDIGYQRAVFLDLKVLRSYIGITEKIKLKASIQLCKAYNKGFLTTINVHPTR